MHAYICHLLRPADDDTLSLTKLWSWYATNKTLNAMSAQGQADCARMVLGIIGSQE